MVQPGPRYLRDLIIELALPPAVNEVAYKLFCLDTTHAILDEQTIIDQLTCSLDDSGSERLFQVVASGSERLSVACRSLKLESHRA